MIAALIGLPLFGATVLLLGGRKTNAWGHYLAVAMSGSAFLVGVSQFVKMLSLHGEERAMTQHCFRIADHWCWHTNSHLLTWVHGT